MEDKYPLGAANFLIFRKVFFSFLPKVHLDIQQKEWNLKHQDDDDDSERIRKKVRKLTSQSFSYFQHTADQASKEVQLLTSWLASPREWMANEIEAISTFLSIKPIPSCQRSTDPGWPKRTERERNEHMENTLVSIRLSTFPLVRSLPSLIWLCRAFERKKDETNQLTTPENLPVTTSSIWARRGWRLN